MKANRFQSLILDVSDGVETDAAPAATAQSLPKSPMGSFGSWQPDGVAVVDPLHLPFNKLAPPVHVNRFSRTETHRRLGSSCRQAHAFATADT